MCECMFLVPNTVECWLSAQYASGGSEEEEEEGAVEDGDEERPINISGAGRGGNVREEEGALWVMNESGEWA